MLHLALGICQLTSDIQRSHQRGPGLRTFHIIKGLLDILQALFPLPKEGLGAAHTAQEVIFLDSEFRIPMHDVVGQLGIMDHIGMAIQGTCHSGHQAIDLDNQFRIGHLLPLVAFDQTTAHQKAAVGMPQAIVHHDGLQVLATLFGDVSGLEGRVDQRDRLTRLIQEIGHRVSFIVTLGIIVLRFGRMRRMACSK